MRQAALVVLFVFVLLSGCVGNMPYYDFGSSNSGVKVVSFKAEPSKIYDNQEAYVTLTLKNVGDFIANDIYVTLYGLGNDWGVLDVQGEKTQKGKTSWFDMDASFRVNKEYKISKDGSVIVNGDISINNIENILEGKMPDIGVKNLDVFIQFKDISIMFENLEYALGIAKESNIDRFSKIPIKDLFKKATRVPPVLIDYLLPKSPEHNFDGESIDVVWLIKPPGNLPYMQEMNNDIHARICYTYTTKLNAKVTYYSWSEFLQQKPRVVNKKYTASGPVSLEVDVPQPLILRDGELTTFIIKVKNTGGGSASLRSCKNILGIGKEKDDIKDYGALNIKIKGFDCDVAQDSKIYLVNNDEEELVAYCKLKNPSNYAPVQEGILTVELQYQYSQDVTTNIKVIGLGDKESHSNGIRGSIQDIGIR